MVTKDWDTGIGFIGDILPEPEKRSKIEKEPFGSFSLQLTQCLKEI